MVGRKQTLRISSVNTVRCSVLRLLHKCLAAASANGDAHSAIALSKYILKEFDEQDMLIYVETTQYEAETKKHTPESAK